MGREVGVTPAELQNYRKSLALNVRQFASFLGVTPQCVSNWEHGRAPISHLVRNYIDSLKIIEELRQPKLPLPIPEGLCQCGCGQKVQPVTKTRTSRGLKKGDYPAFLSGHNIKVERVR